MQRSGKAKYRRELEANERDGFAHRWGWKGAHTRKSGKIIIERNWKQMPETDFVTSFINFKQTVVFYISCCNFKAQRLRVMNGQGVFIIVCFIRARSFVFVCVFPYHKTKIYLHKCTSNLLHVLASNQITSFLWIPFGDHPLKLE